MNLSDKKTDVKKLNSPLVSNNHEETHRDKIVIGSWLIQKTKHTQRNYQRVLNGFFMFFPGISIPEITTAHISVFLKQWERPDQVATKKLYKNILSSFLSYAVKLGRIDKNACMALDLIRVPDRLVSKVLSSEQVERLIDFSKHGLMAERNHLMICMLYYLGVRVGELCLMQVNHFYIREDKKVQLMIEGKGRKIRHILLPELIIKVVNEYISQSALTGTDFLFKSNRKPYGKMTERQINHIIKKIAKKAKINPLPSPHWLRHTNATHSLENGAPIHVVQKTLGHSSIATTGKYLDIRPQESSGEYLKKFKGVTK